MPIRAVLFDLDGTLLYSLADLAASMNAVLSRDALPLHATETYKHFIGEGVEKLVERALPPSRREPELITRYVAKMRAEYSQRWNHKSRLYPGIDMLLDALVERELTMMVLSNKPHDFTVRIVEHYFARWPFADVAGARADVPKKPDPRAALRMARGLSLEPNEVLYVGDSDTDMLTARAAGMPACAALWGYGDRAELEAAGAAYLVSDPQQVLAFL